MRPEPTLTRFWRKVERGDGCWQWIGGLNANGYGYLHYSRNTMPQRSVLAHRYAYTLLVGPIPEGLQIDHLCRNRACVNPAHLEPVTSAENTRRGLLGVPRATCPHGHPYDDENTGYRRHGDRVGQPYCKTCHRERQRQLRIDHPEKMRARDRERWPRRPKRLQTTEADGTRDGTGNKGPALQLQERP